MWLVVISGVIQILFATYLVIFPVRFLTINVLYIFTLVKSPSVSCETISTIIKHLYAAKYGSIVQNMVLCIYSFYMKPKPL